MKALLLVMSILASVPVIANESVCGAPEAQALGLAVSRLQVGETNLLDVEKAQLNLYRALYACGVFNETGYCAVAQNSAWKIVELTEKLMELGEGNMEDYTRAQTEYAAILSACVK